MQLAERFPITIISADSRQVYRDFDIGTAKPTRQQQDVVPHVGINVIDPAQRCSAWSWAELARTAIHEARAAGRTPVIVGGTGFYIRALTHPIANLPDLDAARRRALSDWLDVQPPSLWQQWCERLDPDRARLGPVQWRRAIEVALLSGERLSTLHAQSVTAQPLAIRYLVVDPGPVLGQRIADRTSAMLNGGWMQEVEDLSSRVPPNAPAWQATGYGSVQAHLRGELTLAQATEHVVIRTRQYAKRQRTWFRLQLDASRVTRVSPLSTQVMADVLTWWQDQPEEQL